VSVTDTMSRRAGGSDHRNDLGRYGERLAAAHLQALGYEILARNQRSRFGEIDLVAREGGTASGGGTIVFVEVKTRRVGAHRSGGPGMTRSGQDSALGWPSARQRRRLRRLASAWLSETRGRRPWAREIRFDVVRVILADGCRRLAVEHVTGAP
jgi:putative endonuclease